MIVDVKVPILAESIAEATLLEWRKAPGDPVVQDELLLELETDKVVLEINAPVSGVLQRIAKQAGETALSEEVLASIDTDSAHPAATPAEPSAATLAEPPATVPAAAPAEPPAEPGTASAGAPALSPAVRRLISEHDVDVSKVRGTGKDGRIVKADVTAYLTARDAAPPPAAAPRPTAPPAAPPPAAHDGERREPMSRLRRTIARRLLDAQHNAAILTTFNEVNMAPIMELRGQHRERFQQEHGVKLGFMSFFTKATVQALQRFPQVNAFIDGDDLVFHDYHHIGIAVGTPRGLVVPVLKFAECLSFAEIERHIADFGERAQNGRLTPDELADGTFTITNGGVFGSLLSTPILNPPQSAILGMHAIQKRPVAEDDAVVIRPMMYIALSYDHRIVDGREAVQFLVAIKEALEDPSRMLLAV